MPAIKEKAAEEPRVLRFRARPSAGSSQSSQKRSWSIDLPAKIAKEVAGLTTVEGTMNGHPFRAALERDAEGSRLRLGSALRAGAGARDGEAAEIAILGPEPKLRVPADLRTALAASARATALWKELTDLGRRDYLRWVEGTANAQTRARRVKRTVEQLAEGKRRPCCVNVYEYVLDRTGAPPFKRSAAR